MISDKAVIIFKMAPGWFAPQLVHETKIIACSAHSTASRGPSGTGPSSAIMSDALTSVRAILIILVDGSVGLLRGAENGFLDKRAPRGVPEEGRGGLTLNT